MATCRSPRRPLRHWKLLPLLLPAFLRPGGVNRAANEAEAEGLRQKMPGWYLRALESSRCKLFARRHCFCRVE